MAIFNYKCKKCNNVFEYHSRESFSVPEDMRLPEDNKCECGGELEKVWDLKGGHGGVDIVGYCYDNYYGKKAWKKNLSQSEQARVLNGERAPY